MDNKSIEAAIKSLEESAKITVSGKNAYVSIGNLILALKALKGKKK